MARAGSRAAAAALASLGATVVDQQVYRAADKDMSAQLLSIKNNGAEAIILFPYSSEVPIVLRQRRQLNLGIPLIGASATCRTGAMGLMAPQDLEGVYCFTDNYLAGNVDELVRAWVERYQKLYGVPPDSYGVAAYDGAFILKQAIEKAGTEPKALRDAIAAVRDFKGVGGTYSFDQNGEGVHQVVILRAKPGTRISSSSRPSHPGNRTSADRVSLARGFLVAWPRAITLITPSISWIKMMNQLVQILVNGTSMGCIYGLVALGFILIYNATGVVNFAQAEFVMVGAISWPMMVDEPAERARLCLLGGGGHPAPGWLSAPRLSA